MWKNPQNCFLFIFFEIKTEKESNLRFYFQTKFKTTSVKFDSYKFVYEYAQFLFQKNLYFILFDDDFCRFSKNKRFNSNLL